MSRFYKLIIFLMVSILIILSASENFTVSQEVNNTSSNDTDNISFNLSSQINETINSTTYKHSSWGILVQDQETGEIIYDKNSQDLFVPGSTTKLFITAAVLDSFGSDYRFKTPVYYNGEIDSEGVLNGDLILVASGDLTMGGRNTPDGKMAFKHIDHSYANTLGNANLTRTDPLTGINDLARQVKSSGINEIQGNVIIDDRLFEKTMAPTGEYLISPIMINDNLIDLEIVPGKNGENATINWRPKSSIYTLSSRVETITSGENNITVNFDGETIQVEGQILENSPPIIRTITVEDPSSWARTLFMEALKREGVQINASNGGKNPQELLNNTTYAENQQVASFTSLPLSENIKVILKLSHNIQADTLVLLLAANNGQKTFSEGMQLEGNFLENSGIERNSLALSDGRGGSESDRISPLAINQLLNRVQDKNYFSAYYESLPVMGYDGTLEGVVSNNSSIYGNVYAKTGTAIAEDKLNNRGILLSQSMAGYMVTKSGRKLIFSIFINNVPLEKEGDNLLIEEDIFQILEKIYEIV